MAAFFLQTGLIQSNTRSLGPCILVSSGIKNGAGSSGPFTLTLLAMWCWLRGTVVERRTVTGKLSLFYARPAADG